MTLTHTTGAMWTECDVV